MARILRSRLADQDLHDIWRYVEERNPRAADKLIDEFTAAFEMLARHTGIGTPRRHIDPSLCVYPVRRYVVIFRRFDDGIEIIRVAHGARDLRKLKLQ